MIRCALPLVLLLALSGACSPPEEGMWRDQLVFVADDGPVVPVGVLRWADGHAEAKGWLGRRGAWETTFFQRFSVTRAGGPDAARALHTLSRRPGTAARVSLERHAQSVVLTLRTPSRRLVVSAEHLTALGRTSDPEGTSIYRAGRARLTGGLRAHGGWLITEQTPPDRPRRGFVDFGDFVFVILAHPERGVVVAKRSRDHPAFDHALWREGGRVRQTDRVRVRLTRDTLSLSLPALHLWTTVRVGDRQRADGRAPGGSPVRYETLLLEGDFSGVAFIIRSAQNAQEEDES